jgi:mono/diheme cytochrome c family protein
MTSVWMPNLAFIVPVVASVVASSANGQPLTGDGAQGHALARAVCAECHSIERRQADGDFLPGPAFKAIADRASTTEVSLRVFFRTPHRDMPNLRLTESETNDIIEYILSLK